MPLPKDWETVDLSDYATREAFADWLEERGDPRAEEVRRLWIRKDKFQTAYTVQYGGLPYESWAMSLETARERLRTAISQLFWDETQNWRTEKKEHDDKIRNLFRFYP